MEYVGEHLLPGQLGHFLILLAFCSAIFSSVVYYLAAKGKGTDFLTAGKLGFFIHGVSVFGIIATLFYIMTNHYYEYSYAWEHVSDDLPFRYIFSAFWEGQEGSFLLWMFWHVVLGFVMMLRGSRWESGTMSVLSLIQVVLMSMILGLYFDFGFTDFKLGSNPFILLRDVQSAPIFNNVNYLSLITGTGLNPLLQNYWMTIHPPVLFLGFASTAIPFGIAVSGFIQKQYQAFIGEALTWSLFSAGFLGLGILMGGAWAYEALSFGGYWAWDPVENMSLVPWLVLVAGVHTLLIAKHTNRSIGASFIFLSATFILIVYSTFLTRSGILGDTSVHSFTEMGLETQLLIFIFTFLFVAVWVYVKHYKHIPTIKGEEEISSKEFWLFIGALVLIFSGVLITFTTSIPVYNKIFEGIDSIIPSLNMLQYVRTAPEDPVAHYNKYQMWIGVLVTLLSGFTVWLRYKEFNFKSRVKQILLVNAIGIVGGIAMTILTTYWIVNLYQWYYLLLCFCAYYTIIVNTYFLVSIGSQRSKSAASIIAHTGFGIMIIGILASGLDKEVISRSFFSQGIIQSEDGNSTNNNLLLFKDIPMQMKEYELNYRDDTTDIHTRTFFVDCVRKNEAGEVVESFTLTPNVLYDKGKTKIAASNPSTKHYLHKDVFTHISALPIPEMAPGVAGVDSLEYVEYQVGIGDTIFTKKSFMILNSISTNPEHKMLPPMASVKAGAKLEVRQLDSDVSIPVEPIYYIVGQTEGGVPIEIDDLSTKIKFIKIVPDENEFRFAINEEVPKKDYIVLEAIVFPGINLFWLGTLMMIIGLLWGMYIRKKQLKG